MRDHRMKAQLLQDIGESHITPLPPDAGVLRTAAPQPTEPPPPAPHVWNKRVEPEWHPPETPPFATDPAPMDFSLPDFAGGDADGTVKPAPTQRTWLGRWGRVVTWGIVVLIAVFLAGGAFWLYNESKVDRTISALAKYALPPRPNRPPPAPMPATAIEPAAAPAIASPPPVEEAPRVDSSAPQRISRKLAQKTARSDRPEPDRAHLRSETLKQCRAAGYHAARCAKLGCTTTKYGLSCKGSPR
jgi:hypothetical protein